MRAAGIQGLAPAKFVTTTIADPTADQALDKVDRQFTASGPDRLWVADITYGAPSLGRRPEGVARA